MNVLKRFLVLALSVICLAGASAQDFNNARVTVGAKGGVSLSKTNFNPSVPQTLLPGATLGATFKYQEEKYFALVAELNFTQRGWKETFEGTDYHYQRRLSYLQLPIMTHLCFGSEKVHGFFNAGPEIGYLVATSTSANFDIANYSALPDFPAEFRSTAQFALDEKNRFDYGITAGAGIEWFQNKKNSFTLEGRFYYGLADVFGNRKKDAFSASSGMTILVTLGYNVRIR